MKKNLLKTLLKIFGKAFTLIDNVIEFKFFKPISLSIIIIFVFFKSLSLLQYFLNNSSKEVYNNVNNLQTVTIHFDQDKQNFNFLEEESIVHVIKQGDTILKVLLDNGFKENEIFSMLSAMKEVFDPRLIVEGNELKILYSLGINYDRKSGKDIKKDVTILKLIINLSEDEKILVSRQKDDSYKAQKEKIELVKSIERYYGAINSGLYLDGVALGLSSTAVMNMINLYSYDIDFQRDIRVGDEFEVIIEALYTKDGKKVRDGDIIFTSISVSNRTLNMYMHEYKGRTEYFNEKGNSIKKSLLKTPINGARVSSRFGMRKHPILGYSRLHKGIDFAARSGTPILAAGDGIITFRGRNGGYGNYIKIRHNAQYSTSYAHASRFNKRFRLGSRVKQGDVISYVGTTGRSTGPHLHFEVIKNGNHINPSSVKSSSGIMLKGSDYKEFVKVRDRIENLRKNIPNKIHILK